LVEFWAEWLWWSSELRDLVLHWAAGRLEIEQDSDREYSQWLPSTSKPAASVYLTCAYSLLKKESGRQT
jgi:hypothetical protein